MSPIPCVQGSTGQIGPIITEPATTPSDFMGTMVFESFTVSLGTMVLAPPGVQAAAVARNSPARIDNQCMRTTRSSGNLSRGIQ